MATTIVPKDKKTKNGTCHLGVHIPTALKVRIDVAVARRPGLKLKEFVMSALEKAVEGAERRDSAA